MAIAELHSRTLSGAPAHQAASHDELHELLTVDEVAALLKVSKSWVYEHTRSRSVPAIRATAAHQDRQVRALRARAVRAFHREAMPNDRDSVRRTRYNRRQAKPRRANERKGCLSNGSTETTVRKRVSSRKRKGVGDSLAGDRNRSRRHEEAGAALRERSGDVTQARRRTSSRRSSAAGRHKAPSAIPRDVRDAGGRMAGDGAADVQALDAEEPSAHPRASTCCRGSARRPLADVTRQEIQAYVAHLTQAGYAPKTIDHIHDVLERGAPHGGEVGPPVRTIRRAAWTCRRSKTVRPKWALTIPQAAALLEGSCRRWRERWWGWRC